MIQPVGVLKLPLNKSEKFIFKSRLGVMFILVRKIAVAQVYQGLTERKLWPGIRVKNQSRAIETGDLDVMWDNEGIQQEK